MQIKTMIELKATIEEWKITSNVAQGTPVDILEKYSVYLMQYCGKCREQAAEQAAAQKKANEPKEEVPVTEEAPITSEV